MTQMTERSLFFVVFADWVHLKTKVGPWDLVGGSHDLLGYHWCGLSRHAKRLIAIEVELTDIISLSVVVVVGEVLISIVVVVGIAIIIAILVVVVAHHVVLVIVCSHFVHLSDVLSFPFVHKGEVHEDVAFHLPASKYLQHRISGLRIQGVAVFALAHFLTFHVEQS